MIKPNLIQCSKCGKELSEDEAVRFKGKNWCQEHYRAEIGLPEKLDIERDQGTSKGSSLEGRSTARYPALRTIAGVYRVVAIIWGLLGAAGMVVGLSLAIDSPETGWSLAFGSLLFGVIGVVTYLAVAEGVRLAIDIEQHTRSTAHLLRQLLASDDEN